MNPPISEPIRALAHLSRHNLSQSCLNVASASTSIFTKLYPEAAIAAALHADKMREAGVMAASPLAGLPVSIKDLFDVAGEATRAGSVILYDAPYAASDAPAVQRLRAAGAAIIGKTNMTEFAFSGVGLNPHHGTPVNPADRSVDRIPGGSSSGAAVSVAEGLCVAGLGSDTGGSIRIPAALCGLVGFKPTARRVPTTGALPLSQTLDSIGAITRSVTDCIIVDRIIADLPLTIPQLPISGLRLAVPATLMMDNLDPHVAASFAAALSSLSAAGARIIDVTLAEIKEYLPINKFSGVEAYAWHRELLEKHGDRYDQRVAKRIKLGATMSGADYIHLHAARRAWIAKMEAAIAPFDALIMPTVPIVAPLIADLEESEDEFFKTNSLLLRNCAAINMLDGCAVSLPCHAKDTLPVGLMIAGPAMSDARILGIATAIENELRHSF